MDFNSIKEIIIPQGIVTEIKNSLNNVMWKKAFLPSIYQQVEYIEATGSQYIEINYIATEKTNSKGKFQITDTTKANMLFGSRMSSTSKPSYGFNWGGGKPYKFYNTYYGTAEAGMTSKEIDEEIHTFEKKRHRLYIDDELLHTRTDTDGTKEFTTPSKMIVFGCNTAGTIGLFTYARIFYLQFYDNDTLMVDLIPCYRKTDNAIGMYDVINNIFYENKGTEQFIKGGDVESESSLYQEVEYIESTGTQYIDTGLAGIDGYTLECDMTFTEWFSTYNYISGCADGSSNRIYFTRYARDSSQKFRYTYNNSSSKEFEAPALNERFTMKAVMEKGKQEQYINGVLKSSSEINTEVSTTQNIFLFCASYGSDGVTGNSSARIYRAKFYYAGKLVRDLVPCYRKKDNVIGMYDTLTNVFYGNIGTGEFIKGNNV